MRRHVSVTHDLNQCRPAGATPVPRTTAALKTTFKGVEELCKTAFGGACPQRMQLWMQGNAMHAFVALHKLPCLTMSLTSATNVDTVLRAPENPTLTEATRSRPQYANPARFIEACKSSAHSASWVTLQWPKQSCSKALTVLRPRRTSSAGQQTLQTRLQLQRTAREKSMAHAIMLAVKVPSGNHLAAPGSLKLS